MDAPHIVATYETDESFQQVFDAEVSAGGLLVHGATLQNAAAMSPVVVDVRVASRRPVEVAARVAAVMDGVGVAVVFDGKPQELQRLVDTIKKGAAAEEGGGTAAERIREMNAAQRMQRAGSADREERMALLRDPNKVLHLYVLKNPRIGTDEVLWAARQTSLSPDALKFIAEHPEWGTNASICAAVVRNPHTPTTLAIRLLDKLPHQELRTIAKNATARQAIVQAARKKINE